MISCFLHSVAVRWSSDACQVLKVQADMVSNSISTNWLCKTSGMPWNGNHPWNDMSIWGHQGAATPLPLLLSCLNKHWDEFWMVNDVISTETEWVITFKRSIEKSLPCNKQADSRAKEWYRVFIYNMPDKLVCFWSMGDYYFNKSNFQILQKWWYQPFKPLVHASKALKPLENTQNTHWQCLLCG